MDSKKLVSEFSTFTHVNVAEYRLCSKFIIWGEIPYFTIFTNILYLHTKSNTFFKSIKQAFTVFAL